MTKFRPVPLASTLLLAVGLSACAQLDGSWDDSRPTLGPSRSSEAFPPPEPRPARAAAVPRQAKPAEKRQAQPAGVVRGEPLKLLGLSEQETAELLGKPAEEAEQPPGKVWVYRASGCQLSVHLFPDMEKGGFYALDYKADEGSRDVCLGKLAVANRRD
jgi:hypothetical protein